MKVKVIAFIFDIIEKNAPIKNNHQITIQESIAYVYLHDDCYAQNNHQIPVMVFEKKNLVMDN